MQNVIVITKEVLSPSYLEPYGGTAWPTPAISRLAARGTVFLRHFASAPSTAMSVTCMFSGLDAYQLDRKAYHGVPPFRQCPTLFDEMRARGYACHVVWDQRELKLTLPYTNCFGEETLIHSPDFHSGATDQELFDLLRTQLDAIQGRPLFLWMHLPHVLGRRRGYGMDVDLFDTIVGEAADRFGDQGLFVTADHAHMNMRRGVVAYGFHVHNAVIRIPLITPRLATGSRVEFPTSSAQLKSIVLNREVEPQHFVYSDSAYYAQYQRKLAIIAGDYKYIYNKQDDTEELYDYAWDPEEQVNLLDVLYDLTVVDLYRGRRYQASSVYFYPHRERACEALKALRTRRLEIWRTGTAMHEVPRALRASFRRRYFGWVAARLRRKHVRAVRRSRREP